MDALQNLGIDVWSIILYLVNFGVLLVVLQKFVFKPLLAFIDKRREEISTNVNAAEAMRVTLEEQRTQEESARRVREQELDERLRSAKQVAREEAKKTITEAEAQRSAILMQARESADETIRGAMDEAQQQLLERIETIVTHVLQDAVSEKVVQESVQKSWAKLRQDA